MLSYFSCSITKLFCSVGIDLTAILHLYVWLIGDCRVFLFFNSYDHSLHIFSQPFFCFSHCIFVHLDQTLRWPLLINMVHSPTHICAFVVWQFVWSLNGYKRCSLAVNVVWYDCFVFGCFIFPSLASYYSVATVHFVTGLDWVCWLCWQILLWFEPTHKSHWSQASCRKEPAWTNILFLHFDFFFFLLIFTIIYLLVIRYILILMKINYLKKEM